MVYYEEVISMENEVLTCSEVAEILGISRRQVVNYIRNGIETEHGTLRLKARIMVRTYRIFRRDLDEFMYSYYKETIFFRYFKM